jgi:hypothetical protein
MPVTGREWIDIMARLKEGSTAIGLRIHNEQLLSPPAAGDIGWRVCSGRWPWHCCSPLLIYYQSGVMPLAALFGIAGGIALALALAGRRLHDSLLDDALSGREGKGKFLMTFGLALLVLFLVLLGGVVALVLLLRSKSAGLPV